MQIPAWVEKGLRSNAAKSTARLKFIVGNIAARHTGRASMRALAEKVGLDHSTISGYIRRGAFSPQAAQAIVSKLNDPTISATMLTVPLTLPREPD